MGKVMGIIGAVVVLGGIAAGVLTMEDRYANAESIKQLNQAVQTTNLRLDQHFARERLEYLESRIDRIVDRCGTVDPMRMPEPDRSTYRDYVREKKQIEAALKTIKTGKQ